MKLIKFERPCNFLGPWGKMERNKGQKTRKKRFKKCHFVFSSSGAPTDLHFGSRQFQ